jgi:predicted lipoprotein with Yx(FWY)xxD motif
MTTTMDADLAGRGSRGRRAQRTRRLAAAVGAAALMSLLFTATASADPQKKPPVVVTAARRPAVGRILVTAAPTRATLYRDTNDPPNTPTCTGGCASVWPPLVLPAGDTTPRGAKGVTGLGTVKIAGGLLQVTYNGEPLYTFVSDSGHSVNGNGAGPFAVVPAP